MKMCLEIQHDTWIVEPDVGIFEHILEKNTIQIVLSASVAVEQDTCSKFIGFSRFQTNT